MKKFISWSLPVDHPFFKSLSISADISFFSWYSEICSSLGGITAVGKVPIGGRRISWLKGRTVCGWILGGGQWGAENSCAGEGGRLWSYLATKELFEGIVGGSIMLDLDGGKVGKSSMLDFDGGTVGAYCGPRWTGWFCSYLAIVKLFGGTVGSSIMLVMVGGEVGVS